MDFNKIVKRLWNKCWKVFFREDIFELIDPEKKEEYANKVSKLVYRLKASGVIMSIKAGVYIIPDSEDEKLNKIDLMDKYYFKLIKKIITKEVSNSYYISWIQSLQYHMKNFEIPDRMYIVNRSVQKRVYIWKRELVFKTISWNKHDWSLHTINLYNLLSKYTLSKEIDWVYIRCSWLELSLLEASLVTDPEQWIDVWLVNKAIKKYWSIFSAEVFEEIWKYKYIMSFNRLKEISKSIDPEFSKLCLEVIKKNGNLFIWEWNRAI